MTKRNVISLYKAMDKIATKVLEMEKDKTTLVENTPSVKFKYGVLTQLKRVRNEIEVLQKMEEDMASILQTFHQKQQTLLLSYNAKEVEGGEGKYMLPTETEEDRENVKKFQGELDILKEECKDDINLYEIKSKEYTTFLETDAEVDVYKMDLDQFPKWVSMEDIGIMMELGMIN